MLSKNLKRLNTFLMMLLTIVTCRNYDEIVGTFMIHKLLRDYHNFNYVGQSRIWKRKKFGSHKSATLIDLSWWLKPNLIFSTTMLLQISRRRSMPTNLNQWVCKYCHTSLFLSVPLQFDFNILETKRNSIFAFLPCM